MPLTVRSRIKSLMQTPDSDRQDAERDHRNRDRYHEVGNSVESHPPAVDVTVFAVKAPACERDECTEQTADHQRADQGLTFGCVQFQHVTIFPQSGR